MSLVSQTEQGKKSMGLDTGLPGSTGSIPAAKTDSKLTLPCVNLPLFIKKNQLTKCELTKKLHTS